MQRTVVQEGRQGKWACTCWTAATPASTWRRLPLPALELHHFLAALLLRLQHAAARP